MHRKETTYIATSLSCTAGLAFYVWHKSNASTSLLTGDDERLQERIRDAVSSAVAGLFGGLVTMKYYHVALMLVSLVSAAWGMEYYARYFHRELWHNEKSSTYKIHQSHHTAKSVHDAFEANDLLGIMNFFVVIGPFIWSAQAGPATCGSSALFGLCAGISIFGTSYMIVHDGVHHRRFPVYGIDRISWIKKVADAHKHHHKSDQGAPFGLFLGPQEVEAQKAGVPPAPMPGYLKAILVTCSSIAVTGLAMGY